jgi:hypothetical protein
MPGHMHIVLIEHNNRLPGRPAEGYAPVFEAIRFHRPDPAPSEVPPLPPREIPAPPPPGYLPDPQPTPPTPPEPPNRPVDTPQGGGPVLFLTRRWS